MTDDRPRPRRHVALPPTLAPRGLSRVEAAAYIGVSAGKFDDMVADGRMPAPISIDSRRVWDRHAVDRAFDALAGEEPNEWDALLGLDQQRAYLNATRAARKSAYEAKRKR